MKPKMNRRTFLKGAGQVSLALPVLEIMLDGNGAFAQNAAPKRFGMFLAGQSLGGDNDNLNYFIPATTGANYPLTVSLQPLGTTGTKADMNLVTGMKIEMSATAAGGRDDEFHADSHYPQVNGVNNSMQAEGADQIVGRLIGAGTRFRTLNYQAQPAFYVPGYDFSGRNYFTFKSVNGQIQPVQNQTSPLAAYQSLFHRLRAAFGRRRRRRGGAAQAAKRIGFALEPAQPAAGAARAQ
jgi:hypothetical protein